MAKKSLSAAQISAFLSQDTEADLVREQPEQAAPEQDSITPIKGTMPAKGGYEPKSQRVNLLLQPSIYKAAKKQAKALGYRSFNDYINELLKAQTARG